MNQNFESIESNINQREVLVQSMQTVISDLTSEIVTLTEVTGNNGTILDEISTVLTEISETLISIDTKLTTTSPATISDQLICRGQPRNLATETMLCLQASSPSSTRSLTLAQIYAEGWKAVSVGGPEDFYAGYIFHK